jgi:pyruvate/2-oxoglutarate dehydrogenase complex dihydrolipoamide dehydrogenase (E3) component
VPFSGNDRAICDGDTRGFLKVLTPPGKDVILGATLVGAHAGEIIHEIVLAMQAGKGLNAIAGMVHIYPTRAEILRRAADEARRAGFTPRMQRMLRAYLGWRRR